MKKILIIVGFIIIASCNQQPKNILTVKGEIKGLTKGTLYLQKIKDTVLVTVDSIFVEKNGKFELKDSILSPEIYYLKLDAFPNDYIIFFAEEGTTEINSKVEKFGYSSKIKGSENQKLLDEYNIMIKKFNDEKLNLIKESLLAQKNKDIKKIDSINDLNNKHLKRRYLYTTNFAVKNAHKEIAPYLALTELYDANIFLLDTISNSMDDRIKKSKYGMKFISYLKKIKKSEQDSITQ